MDNGTTKRVAVAYCRVSTGRQAREGASLEEQKRRASAWAFVVAWCHKQPL